MTPSEILFELAEQNYGLLIFLLVFAFLFASLGRLRIFHHNRPAQAIVSLVISFGTAGIIQSQHWEQMTAVMAARYLKNMSPESTVKNLIVKAVCHS